MERGGGGGGGEGGKQGSEYFGAKGANLFAGCKLIGTPADPLSVPNNYTSHIKSW